MLNAQRQRPDSFHEALLRLYRLSQESMASEFQEDVLDLLRELIPFDTAMWQTVTTGPNGFTTQTVHLHREPAEMLHAYQELKQHDPASQSVLVAPGSTRRFHAPTDFGAPQQRTFREFLNRFEHQNVLITASSSPEAPCAQWISLYRAAPDHHCSEEERRALCTLAPHVLQALNFNRIQHMRQTAGQGHHRAGAIADVRGVICHSEPKFTQLMSQQWPDWKPVALPHAVLDGFSSGTQEYRSPQIVISCKREHGLLFLGIRRACKADFLSAREALVATLLAKGLTHKEIAQAVDRSPATVRNQIRSVYEKLAVTNVAELIRELQAGAT